MTDWRDISTAPKMGDYLIYQPKTQAGRSVLHGRICFSGQGGHVRQATHWMPLPLPPKIGETE